MSEKPGIAFHCDSHSAIQLLATTIYRECGVEGLLKSYGDEWWLGYEVDIVEEAIHLLKIAFILTEHHYKWEIQGAT